jgi:hypothetical protein
MSAPSGLDMTSSFLEEILSFSILPKKNVKSYNYTCEITKMLLILKDHKYKP